MSLPAADPPGTDWGRPVVPSTGVLRPLGIGEVHITGGFWAGLQDLNAHAIIDHAERWMERLGWIGNFDAAVEGRLPADRHGREFSDSDVYKLIEAMAWEVGRTGDADLDARLTALVARIAAAQEPDGYLNTMFGRPGQAPRYTDLAWGHELYCYGHLIQAAVARGRTTGSDSLVEIAIRAADHVCEEFGPHGRDAVDGHPEIEAAMVELSRYTGQARYLDQARLFVERRGHGRLGDIEAGRQYFQDDMPVREASVLRGHAVRALYLAAGAADVAVETGDKDLLCAVADQLAHTVARRTYLTGGMGARHEGESFGDDHELPADRAYSETCAGVAAVMLGHRLLLATGDPAHADLVERVLYNVIATSPDHSGTAFFYANTLHQRVPGRPVAADQVSPRASSSVRAPWFEVSCCPPNVARTLASLAAYLATTDDDGLQLHQYAPALVDTTLPDGRRIAVEVATGYPADGAVTVTAVADAGRPWTLTLRVPSWARRAVLVDPDGHRRRVGPGSVSVTRRFLVGERVRLELDTAPRFTVPDPRIDAVRGCVAVERGPEVLCVESADLPAGADVADLVVDPSVPPRVVDGAVVVSGALVATGATGWPYLPLAGPPVDATGGTEDSGQDGAGPAGAAPSPVDLPLIPYHDWANRGPSTMRVWLPAAG